MTLPETFILTENDWVPNNPALPILVYRELAGGDCEELARHFEGRFAEHGWPPQWRDTIYDYHYLRRRTKRSASPPEPPGSCSAALADDL